MPGKQRSVRKDKDGKADSHQGTKRTEKRIYDGNLRGGSGQGGGNFRIVIVDGGGADDAARAIHALGQVADGYGNPQGAEMLNRGALVHIGAGDNDAPAMEYFGQRSHGDPADAHQMGPNAGADVGLYGVIHDAAPQL